MKECLLVSLIALKCKYTTQFLRKKSYIKKVSLSWKLAVWCFLKLI